MGLLNAKSARPHSQGEWTQPRGLQARNRPASKFLPGTQGQPLWGQRPTVTARVLHRCLIFPFSEGRFKYFFLSFSYSTSNGILTIEKNTALKRNTRNYPSSHCPVTTATSPVPQASNLLFCVYKCLETRENDSTGASRPRVREPCSTAKGASLTPFGCTVIFGSPAGGTTQLVMRPKFGNR